MGTIPSGKRDPAPGVSEGDGSVIRTDMQNLIMDILEGLKDGEHINLLAPAVTKTGAYTIAEEDIVILGDTSGGGFTLTLPASATLGIKRKIIIVKKIAAANNLTIDGNAAETIDGSANLVLTDDNECVILVSDNTNWRVIGSYLKSHTHVASDITDFDTQVRTSRLDQMAVPQADVSMNSNKITNVTDPASDQDAATKKYVDDNITGLKWKSSVRVATTAAGTLATDFENGDTVDGVVLSTGDRILIKDQAAGAENGIYTVNASGAPTRATDFDENDEVSQSAVFAREGTVNADTAWVMTNDGAITLGTTALVFAQFSGNQVSGANIGTAGVGIFKTKNGSTLQFKKINAGSAKITITDDTGNDEVDVDLGTVNHTDISDFDTGVQQNRLDQMAVPTTTVNINNQELNNVKKINNKQSSISYSTSVTLDLNNDEVQTISLTGNITTLATSNRAAGKRKVVYLIGDGSNRTITFNASWKTNPEDASVTVNANKIGVLSLYCKGTAETDIICAFAEFG